jgi:hypothetical protein
MVKLPLIAKATPSFVNFLNTPLTEDDKFLFKLNTIWSNEADPIGYRNQPRYYKFNQHIVFDSAPDPKLTNSKPLNVLIEDRVNQLANKGKLIKMFWSGGIDSTLATAALLPAIKHKDQLEIYLTCESLRENPLFYDYIQQFNVRVRMWSDDWAIPFGPKDLVVTGTSADEITGSLDRSFYDKQKVWLNQPWQIFFKAQGFDAAFIERCEQLFSESQSPINTVFDARWWFYFYIRHTEFVRRDWGYNLENNLNCVEAFYNTEEFDSWSLQNKESVIGSEYCNYKQPFKDVIHRYWPNKDFQLNKEKVTSNLSIQWVIKKMSILNQQYLFIYKNAKGEFKPFRPTQYPFVSKKDVLNCLEQIQHEI